MQSSKTKVTIGLTLVFVWISQCVLAFRRGQGVNEAPFYALGKLLGIFAGDLLVAAAVHFLIKVLLSFIDGLRGTKMSIPAFHITFSAVACTHAVWLLLVNA